MPGLKPIVASSESSRRRSVLIVDDEGMVRRAMERMVAKLGYETHSASNGREAVDAVSRDPQAYSLVVLDMLMPGMGGEETFSQLRSIAPELSVLLSSGLNETEGVSDLMRRGAAGFLQKPYELERLAEELERLVG
jgi:two-component system, cell cycle sensor histidine kinase and response regulator CckA